jgi:hypothetical protein
LKLKDRAAARLPFRPAWACAPGRKTMRLRQSLLASVVFAFAFVGAAQAANQCRDAAGKFIKCPAAAAARCRDAAGKFVKCDAPGAIPVTGTSAKHTASMSTAKAATTKKK